ncbi:MAG: hypothetical protein QM473_15235 [Acidobacteriota bacterium]|nr:hypothetical protein [Acidobacteriota bacterium]
MAGLLEDLKQHRIELAHVAREVGIDRSNVSHQLHGRRPVQDRVRSAALRLIAESDRARRLALIEELMIAGDVDLAGRLLGHDGYGKGVNEHDG